MCVQYFKVMCSRGYLVASMARYTEKQSNEWRLRQHAKGFLAKAEAPPSVFVIFVVVLTMVLAMIFAMVFTNISFLGPGMFVDGWWSFRLLAFAWRPG